MTTTDWASVGGDPAPGDVAAFDILARAFDRTAEDASDAQRSLERLAANVQSAIWEGEAADAFRDKIEELPPQLGKLHDSYDTASGALRSYGSVLADLKARAATALADAGAAEAEGTSNMQAAAQAVAADPETSTAQYEQALANARQRLRGAQDEIERIREERKSAETRLVGRLSDAGDKGIQNERWGGLKRFLKAVGDACELIALAILVVAAVVIVVVALVALASNPAGWAVLAAGISAGLSTAGPLLTAVSIFGVAALGTKIGRLAVGDESVSKGSVALDVGLSLAGPAGKLGGRLFKGLSSGRRATGTADDALDAASNAKAGAGRVDIPVQTTKHGTKRWLGGDWTEELYEATKSVRPFKQADGASVYLREVEPGRYDFIVEDARGIVTARRRFYLKGIKRIARNYGWDWTPPE